LLAAVRWYLSFLKKLFSSLQTWKYLFVPLYWIDKSEILIFKFMCIFIRLPICKNYVNIPVFIKRYTNYPNILIWFAHMFFTPSPIYYMSLLILLLWALPWMLGIGVSSQANILLSQWIDPVSPDCKSSNKAQAITSSCLL
jgi:hypothetical protein